MKVLSMENYTKAYQMVLDKGYDKHNTEKLVIDIFHIIEQHGNTAEFYIEHLPNQK